MSIQVELSALADAVARYRFAYLLTVGGEGSPHALAVTPTVDGTVLTINGIGRRTRDNLLARPEVTLVWPPESVDEYSLIVDGQAAANGESAQITPTRAVLHRPAPRPEPATEGAADRTASSCHRRPSQAAAEPGRSRGRSQTFRLDHGNDSDSCAKREMPRGAACAYRVQLLRLYSRAAAISASIAASGRITSSAT